MGVGCRRLGVVLVLLGMLLPSLARIHLKPLINKFLPFSIDTPPQFGFDKWATEQIALDTERQILYAVGNNNIFALDISDPGALPVVAQSSINSNLNFESVEVCGDYIYTTQRIKDDKLKGFVKIFIYDDTSDPANPKFVLFSDIIVGSQPDTLGITKDCRTIVVTLEGKVFVDASDIILEPEGGIGVIRWDPSQPDLGVKYTELDFKMFNSKECELREAGVRFVYRENFNTISQDLEPESVTLNAAGTRAYVVLQENNAIVVVDISDGENPAIIDIVGLGAKSFKNSELDPSTADGGINFNKWPVKGFFQPDGIKAFIHDGIEYIITANEGSAKFYEGSSGVLFKEVKSGSMMVSDGEIDESVPESLKAALADNTKLGQLRFSIFSGKNPVTGKFKEFFILGARSFSLRRASDLSLVFESGSSIGKSIAETYPEFFNAKPEGLKKPEELVDNQSPIGGNDPETVEVGEAYDKTLLFIANEFPGTISIYSMSKNDSTPKFESVFLGAEARQGETWNDIYEARRTGDIDPEDLEFVPKSKSASGKPLLYVTGTVSGTVSCYSVEIEEEEEPHYRHGYPKPSTKPKYRKPHNPRERQRPETRERQKPETRERQRPETRERQRPETRQRQGPETRQRQGPETRQRQGPKPRQRQGPEPRQRQRPEPRQRQRPEPRQRQGPETRQRQGPETRERQRPETRQRQGPETRQRQGPETRHRQGPETRQRQGSGPMQRQGPEPRQRQRPEPRQRQRPETRQREGPETRQRQGPETRQRQGSGPMQRQGPGPRQRQRPEPRQRQRPEPRAEPRERQRSSRPTRPTQSHGHYTQKKPNVAKSYNPKY